MSEFLAGLGHAFSYGGTVAIIGLLIVFVGLCILIGFLTLMSIFFKRLSQKSEPVAVSAPPIVTATIEETPPQEDEYADSGELIAAIAAAIQMFDDSGKTLVVKSVRRVNGWKNAARVEQVYKL